MWRFLLVVSHGVDAVFDPADPLPFLGLHFVQVNGAGGFVCMCHACIAAVEAARGLHMNSCSIVPRQQSAVCSVSVTTSPDTPVCSHAQMPMLLLRNVWRGNPWTKIDLCIGKLAELYGD